MKILKKFFSIFFMLGFIFLAGSAGLVRAEDPVFYIAAPENMEKGVYYLGKRKSPTKFYIEQRGFAVDALDTEDVENSKDTKRYGIFIEKVKFGERGEYVVYDENTSSENYTHKIRAINPYHYVVDIHYPFERDTTILDITRESTTSPWKVRPVHTLGVVGLLPANSARIEKAPCGKDTWYIKSDEPTKDISEGKVYNCVMSLASGDEFTDIINFLATFLFK